MTEVGYRPGIDAVLTNMKRLGIPVTRENYIEGNYGSPRPVWTAEHEAELPDELQDWSLFEVVGGELQLKDSGIKVRFNPNHEPAGSDAGGQFASGGGSGDGKAESVAGWKPRAVVAQTMADANASKEEWFKASPFVGKIDDAIAAAPEAQAELGEVGEAIAKITGGEFKNPGVKSKVAAGIERIKEKEKLRGGAERVTDIARGAFVVSEPEQVDAIVRELGKKFEVIAEPWNVTPVKYTDRALQVRFKSGLIGEIQVLDGRMADAKSPDKGGGHNLYVEQRKLDPKNPADRPKFDALTEQMTSHYGKVLDNYSPAWKAALGIGGK